MLSQSYPVLIYIALACSAAYASLQQNHHLPHTNESAPAALSSFNGCDTEETLIP